MEKDTLETIAQRLDRLEKTVAEMHQKLSSLVEKTGAGCSNGSRGKGKDEGR